MTGIEFINYEEKVDREISPSIFFVGLSHKLGKDGEVLQAFCDSTNSGKVVSQVISEVNTKIPDLFIKRTNLVRGVPLSGGKLRYPNKAEKLIGISQLIKEIKECKPKLVYLFGKQVSDFVIKETSARKISDKEYVFGDSIFVLSEHPSYMYIYKRKNLPDYISSITQKIFILLNSEIY